MAMDLESIRDLVAPIVAPLGLGLYDVELTGAGRARAVRVVIERPGGVDLDTITEATRVLAPALAEAGMLRETDVLEVSSPGLERALRRPEHFLAAVGVLVSVKHLREGETVRERGTVVTADEAGFDLDLDLDLDLDDSRATVERRAQRASDLAASHPASPSAASATERIAYADVVACRTVFEWGPAPRPGRGSKPGKGNARRPKESSRS
jgi:Uncharacterized protein conserved in bacteria